MRIWVLIHVWRGLVQEPEIFYKAAEAKQRKRALLKHFNPDYDAVGIFERRIEVAA